MNKLREKILKIMFYEVCEEEMDEIMELIEEHSEESWYAARDYTSICGDHEETWDNWKEWYDLETEVKDEE